MAPCYRAQTADKGNVQQRLWFESQALLRLLCSNLPAAAFADSRKQTRHSNRLDMQLTRHFFPPLQRHKPSAAWTKTSINLLNTVQQKQKNRNKSNNPHLLQLTVNVLNDQIQSYKVFSTCKWNEFETQKEANLLNKVILLVSMQLKHNTYIVWPVEAQWLQYRAA